MRMRKHSLKKNPGKCAFEVSADNFLGFLVHSQGIEVGKNKGKVVLEARPPRNKKELQSLIGKVNFLRRFKLGWQDVSFLISIEVKGSRRFHLG